MEDDELKPVDVPGVYLVEHIRAAIRRAGEAVDGHLTPSHNPRMDRSPVLNCVYGEALTGYRRHVELDASDPYRFKVPDGFYEIGTLVCLLHDELGERISINFNHGRREITMRRESEA